MHDEAHRSKIDDNVAVLTVRPIEFQASSFFKLDLSIVTGIIASITTYLTIVIQFKLSEEQQDAGLQNSSVSQNSSITDRIQNTGKPWLKP